MNIEKNQSDEKNTTKKDILLKYESIDNNTFIINIEGIINMDTYEYVREEIEKIKEDHNPKYYIFELSNLEYISSAGIGIFMNLFESVESTGGKICLVGLLDEVRRVFELVGFLQYFLDVKTVSEVLKELH